jgi:putative nucleotidyltransferase with HDIG domain
MAATHTPRAIMPITRGEAVLLGIVTALALGIALFPWFPAQSSVAAGIRAPWTLTAPRAISYDSDARTEQVRSEAADAVPDVLVLDPAIREQALTELDRQFARIAQLRSDTSVATATREIAIQAIANTLAEPSAAALANASEAEWDIVRAEARAALGRTLSGTLREADLAAARERVTGFLSPALSPQQSQAVRELLVPFVVPTLAVDQERTAALRAEARKGQPPVHVSHGRGDVLVTEGQELTAADIELLERAGLWTDTLRVEHVGAAALLALIAGVAIGGYAAVATPLALVDVRRRALLVGLIALPMLVVKLVLPLLVPDHDRQFLAYALPLAAAPLLAAVLLDIGLAMLLTMVLATAGAFVTAYLPFAQGDVAGGLEAVRMWLAIGAGGFAAALVVARADRTQRYALAGAAAGVGTALALLAVWLIDADRGRADLAWLTGVSAINGALTGLVGLLALAFVRRPFGIVTRVELMELTQLSHPLLRRLQDEAPGTFQHSIVVGNLAERAAGRIGADPLLVRIGAYYHDVGKLLAPAFFIENSGETNPHATLDPLQSTRVILSHVTSGVDIARRAGLPAAVLAFIPQHHGTRLVSFFYRLAADADPNVDPELFRYPGPRPQTREAALVMLADASEASVRASDDHSPERIREVVEGVVRERVEEGQFDECDLSLRDLRIAADSYVSTLTAVYHPRVEYPAPTARELAGRRRWNALADGDELPGARWPRFTRPTPVAEPPRRSRDELDEDSPPAARSS